MAITVQQVIERVLRVMNDENSVRWREEELIAWINDGRRELAAFQPSVFSQTAHVIHDLIDGCFQTLLTHNAYAILEVTHNLNADGSTGSAIRHTPKEVLDAYKPNWRSDLGKSVQNWSQDSINPISFFVYPSVPKGRVMVIAKITPSDLTHQNDVVLPFDQFLVPLTNYVLHRAYAKDAEVAQNAQLSAAYLQLFTTAISPPSKE